MAHSRQREPVIWMGKKYPHVDEDSVRSDDGVVTCPYCHHKDGGNYVVEVTQRGMFEDIHRDLFTCPNCYKRMAIFSITKGRKHAKLP